MNAADRDRVYWRCRRGMRELDLLLQGFHARCYDGLDAAQRTRFERLLEYPDAVLLEWLMGRMVPTDKDVADLVERIRRAAGP